MRWMGVSEENPEDRVKWVWKTKVANSKQLEK